MVKLLRNHVVHQPDNKEAKLEVVGDEIPEKEEPVPAPAENVEEIQKEEPPADLLQQDEGQEKEEQAAEIPEVELGKEENPADVEEEVAPAAEVNPADSEVQEAQPEPPQEENPADILEMPLEPTLEVNPADIQEPADKFVSPSEENPVADMEEQVAEPEENPIADMEEQVAEPEPAAEENPVADMEEQVAEPEPAAEENQPSFEEVEPSPEKEADLEAEHEPSQEEPHDQQPLPEREGSEPEEAQPVQESSVSTLNSVFQELDNLSSALSQTLPSFARLKGSKRLEPDIERIMLYYTAPTKLAGSPLKRPAEESQQAREAAEEPYRGSLRESPPRLYPHDIIGGAPQPIYKTYARQEKRSDQMFKFGEEDAPAVTLQNKSIDKFLRNSPPTQYSYMKQKVEEPVNPAPVAGKVYYAKPQSAPKSFENYSYKAPQLSAETRPYRFGGHY